MKTTDKMLEATKELWKSYNEHPFVKGIQDGSLAKDKFNACSRYELAFWQMAWNQSC